MARSGQSGPFGLASIGDDVTESESAVVASTEPAPSPQLFQGTHFSGQPAVPASVVAGGTFTISGFQHYDNPWALVTPDQRTELTSTLFQDPRHVNHGPIPNCSSRGFNFTLTAPPTPGTSFQIDLRAQQLAVDGWDTRDRFGPITISTVTESEQIVQQAAAWLPWVAGGTVVGAGASRLTQDFSFIEGAGVGAVAGVAGRLGADRLEGVTFPTVPVLATAGLLGAGALLLSEVRGPSIPVISR